MQQTRTNALVQDIGGIVVHYNSSNKLVAFYDYENCEGAVF